MVCHEVVAWLGTTDRRYPVNKIKDTGRGTLANFDQPRQLDIANKHMLSAKWYVRSILNKTMTNCNLRLKQAIELSFCVWCHGCWSLLTDDFQHECAEQNSHHTPNQSPLSSSLHWLSHKAAAWLMWNSLCLWTIDVLWPDNCLLIFSKGWRWLASVRSLGSLLQRADGQHIG